MVRGRLRPVTTTTVAEDNTSKRAQTKAKQEAVAEAVANYDVKQKLHALELLLNDPELKKAPTERAFEVWVGRLAAGTKEKLDWLSNAFATRYQRKLEDGTYAPRLREATTQQVVERLVDFALSATERDREVEKDLGLFEYTADPITGEALLGLSDKVYGYGVRETKYNYAQSLLRKMAEEKPSGEDLVRLVGEVQSALKTVGKFDLGLPERLDGLRTPKEEAEYQKRFNAYRKGLKTKADKAAAEALTNPDGKTTPAVETVISNSVKAEEAAKTLNAKGVK